MVKRLHGHAFGSILPPSPFKPELLFIPQYVKLYTNVIFKRQLVQNIRSVNPCKQYAIRKTYHFIRLLYDNNMTYTNIILNIYCTFGHMKLLSPLFIGYHG